MATSILKNRRFYQIITTLFANSYYFSFLKYCSFPVFNCYSCPLAVFACPVGTIQFFLARGSFPFLAVGIIGLTGILVGRMTCGWLCPFGFLQELMYKISPYRIKLSHKWDNLKYVFLGLGVIILPLFWVDSFGLGEHYFCEICPAGTLEAGIPHLLMDASLRPLAGGFFIFKLMLLFATIFLVFVVRRGFCRLICPLGAMLGVFNGIAGLKISVNKPKCNQCAQCFTDCPVDLNIYEAEGSPSCINCLECTSCAHVNYKFKVL